MVWDQDDAGSNPAIQTMKTIELHQAWVWDCDECGRENVAHGMTADTSNWSDEEKQEMAAMLECESSDEFVIEAMLIAQPVQVTCRFCEHVFAVAEE